MEMARDEVRVMTVHGAKGLEARTVILADTTTRPNGPGDPKLLSLANGALVWATARANDVGAMGEARAAAQQAASDEYRRLLYVAMTRAAERLIVCGAQGIQKIPDGCWYSLVCDALQADCVSEPADDGEGDVLRYRKFPALPTAVEQTVPVPPPASIELPDWLTRAAAPVAADAVTILPSRAVEEAGRRLAGGGRAALLRGSLTHRLLQALPDIPPERRAEAARDYLTRAGRDLEADECARIAVQVMRVIEDPRFRALYAPGSRAEVPIVGRVCAAGRTVAVSGQIDRLAITPEAVLIGDFKSNRPAPQRFEDVPPGYVRQLALYRAVLLRLYPDRPVRAALIWTEVSDLMELSSEALDAALAAITAA
jgi:ATP-dependent helicase/nuclease subunit A